MKTQKIFIGHAVGNDNTEIGFYKGNEHTKWYKSISNASITRLERIIDPMRPYPIIARKQVWIVYRLGA